MSIAKIVREPHGLQEVVINITTNPQGRANSHRFELPTPAH